MIDFNGVSCRYKREYAGEGTLPVTALEDVSFHIPRGSFIALVGRNGSGKSTAARCMNALQLPSGGTVLVDGADTSDDEMVLTIRQKAGMVFQNPDNQLVSSVVEDDVAFGPENLGLHPNEIRKRVDRAMKAAGIYDRRLDSPDELSGGQKQRVAIAGVLAMEPECVIFDEATAMLDPAGRSSVMEMIRRLRERGTTVVLITHFMEEAAEADRILILKEGKLLSQGTPAEIFAVPDLISEAGLDLPAAVKIRNLLRERGADIPDRVLDIQSLAEWIAGNCPGNEPG